MYFKKRADWMVFNLIPLCLLAWSFSGVFWQGMAVAAPSLQFKPVFSAGSRWESNFYQSQYDEHEMYTFLVNPGLKAELQGARSGLSFFYGIEAHFYEDPDGESGSLEDAAYRRSMNDLNDLDYIGHIARLSGRYDLTSRLVFALDANYYHTRYPVYYDRLSTESLHQEYDMFRLTPAVFFDLTRRLTAGLRYQHTEIDLNSDEEFSPSGFNSDNTTNDVWVLTVGWDPWRSVTLDLDMSWDGLDYVDREDNYEAWKINFAFEKRLRVFAFNAGLGYSSRDYENEEFEDQDLYSWKLGVTAQMPEPVERRRSLGRVFTRPVDHFYLGIEQTFNTIGDLFTSTRFVASMGGMYGEKLNGRLKGWYQISDYDSLEGYTPGGNLALRKTEVWDASASIGYHLLRSLMLSGTLGFRQQESNLVDEDYENLYMLIDLSLNTDAWDRGGFTNEALYY